MILASITLLQKSPTAFTSIFLTRSSVQIFNDSVCPEDPSGNFLAIDGRLTDLKNLYQMYTKNYTGTVWNRS